jgi:putative flippase GtrA
MESLKNIKRKLQEKKLWEPLTYLFFGGLTTLVNIVVYFVFREVIVLHYMIANAIAWAASVLFAFFTNKALGL